MAIPPSLGSAVKESCCDRLLQTPRSVIEAFAASESLLPITDGSNSDTRYDRNFIRHEVLPVLEQRWPKYRESFCAGN